MKQRYIRTEQAAIYLGLSQATLVKDRWSGLLHIPYLKVGRSVLYDLSELDDWLDHKRINYKSDKMVGQ